MIHVFGNAAFRAAARTVAAGAQTLAVVALRRQTLGPRPAAGGSGVHQMTGAAGAGFRRDLTAHVACLGRGFPQIVRRIEDLPTRGMAGEAQSRIGPRGSQQLWVLLVLMDVMTGRAQNDRLRIADCRLRIEPPTTWITFGAPVASPDLFNPKSEIRNPQSKGLPTCGVSTAGPGCSRAVAGLAEVAQEPAGLRATARCRLASAGRGSDGSRDKAISGTKPRSFAHLPAAGSCTEPLIPSLSWWQFVQRLSPRGRSSDVDCAPTCGSWQLSQETSGCEPAGLAEPVSPAGELGSDAGSRG